MSVLEKYDIGKSGNFITFRECEKVSRRSEEIPGFFRLRNILILFHFEPKFLKTKKMLTNVFENDTLYKSILFLYSSGSEKLLLYLSVLQSANLKNVNAFYLPNRKSDKGECI